MGMKRQVAYITALCLALGLAGCGNTAKTDNAGSQTTPPPAAEQATTVTVDTSYYTVEIPASWDSECSYEIVEGDSYNYALSFYHNASRDAGNGGWLFSIELLTEYEDYTYLPDYEVLGSLEVYRIGGHNIISTFPTDVQCTEDTAARYNELAEAIPDILGSIKYKDECEFSNQPLEVYVEDEIDEQEPAATTPEASFYSELCAYVVSSCVNYTEWWTPDKINVTDPRYYLLGTITDKNYSEKMAKAKELVDGVYKAGYYEVRSRGAGTIKIGLFTSQESKVYFCYKY